MNRLGLVWALAYVAEYNRIVPPSRLSVDAQGEEEERAARAARAADQTEASIAIGEAVVAGRKARETQP